MTILVKKHMLHPKQIIKGPFGPHAAKLICRKCNVWIKWLPKNYETTFN